MGPTGRELYSNWQNDRAVVLPPANPLPWFAVVIKPQHERAVQDGLCQKGLESFLPTYCAARRTVRGQKALQTLLAQPILNRALVLRLDDDCKPWQRIGRREHHRPIVLPV